MADGWKADIKIIGLDATMTHLKKISKDFSSDLERVVNRSVDYTVAQMQIMAPIDTGVLMNSFKVESHDKLMKEISTNVRYAGYVETGTGRPTPAQPYFFPSGEDGFDYMYSEFIMVCTKWGFS